MKKTIILNENSFNKIKRLIIKETINSNPYLFGTAQENYKNILEGLNKVHNLKTDRYKDYNLEETYNKWADTNFDKSSGEYLAWCGSLKQYIEYLNGGIEFVLNDKVRRIGLKKAYWVFIDPAWANDVIYNHESEKHQSIYPLILKIYQNKPMWNDLFFNPVFENIKKDFFEIRQFVGQALGQNMNYKLLLPINEYKEITKFINSNDVKPELFYTPPQNKFGDEDDF